MSQAKLFHFLWLADWSSTDIAEAYGTNEERVRVLVATELHKSWLEIDEG